MFSLMKSDSNKTVLDIAFDYSDAGLYHDAYHLLYEYNQYRKNNVSPILFYYIGYFARLTGNSELTDKFYKKGSNADEAFCFPSLYWEKIILLDVISTNPKDASAMLYLGNLLYGKTKQYKDALKYWSIAAEIEPNNVQLLRNISIARFNLDNNDGSSFDYLNKAAAIEPDNLQLCYEQNLLAELSNFSFDERTALMEKQKVDFSQWDDLYLQKVHLKNQIGEWKSVLDLLSKHKFVPCEGGEHSIANEYLSANFAMAWKAFNEGFFEKALNYFKSAQNIPINLGGGVWHKILYTPYILGEGLCLNRLNKKTEAKIAFNKIIYFPVNYFATMYLPSFQYYRGCALQELGMFAEGKKEFEALLEDAENCKEAGDFGHFEAARFFNSYFESDKKTKKRHYSMLYALAYLGLGEKEKALEYLKDLLSWDFTNITAKIYYNYIIGEK